MLFLCTHSGKTTSARKRIEILFCSLNLIWFYSAVLISFFYKHYCVIFCGEIPRYGPCPQTANKCWEEETYIKLTVVANRRKRAPFLHREINKMSSEFSLTGADII